MDGLGSLSELVTSGLMRTDHHATVYGWSIPRKETANVKCLRQE